MCNGLVEPLPHSSRRASSANLLPRGQLDRIRRYVYRRPRYHCQIFREHQNIGEYTPRSEILNNLRVNFHLMRRRAKVDGCTLHDLRRSAITNWASQLPIQVVQQLHGHSDIATTRKYCLTVRSEDMVSANEVLNNILLKVRTD